jgi:hypothetical protein
MFVCIKQKKGGKKRGGEEGRRENGVGGKTLLKVRKGQL